MAPAEIWLITGASRGIGAALVAELLGRGGAVVIAGARTTSQSQVLQNLKTRYPDHLHVLTLDVASSASIQTAHTQVTEQLGISSLDYLVNNAATANPERSSEESADSMRDVFNVNVVGSHVMTQTFLPLLRSGQKKTVINVSSNFGSCSERYEEFANRKQQPFSFIPTTLSYKASKAALNMLTVSWAADITPEDGFTFVAIHPGNVATELNDLGCSAWKVPQKFKDMRLTPVQSAQTLLSTISKLSPNDSGRFLRTDGSIFPW